jgi:hypothetical protein
MKSQFASSVIFVVLLFDASHVFGAEVTTKDVSSPPPPATHRLALGPVIALVREGGATSGPQVSYQLSGNLFALTAEADGLFIGGGRMATLALGVGRATNVRVFRFTPWVGGGWMWFDTVDGGRFEQASTKYSGGGPMVRGKLLLENHGFGVEARIDWAFTEWEARYVPESGPTEVIQTDADSLSIGVGCHWWFE